jgi:LPXTG-motif cell wall-anchored protein
VAALAGLCYLTSVMHGISHIMDHGLGGRASDPWTVSLFGLVVLLAFLLVLRRKRA